MASQYGGLLSGLKSLFKSRKKGVKKITKKGKKTYRLKDQKNMIKELERTRKGGS